MNIASREIGLGHPCFIVAEMSCNHNGFLDRALAIIRAAKSAGADAIKFQAFTLEEILALRGEGQAAAPWDAYTKRELYTKALTPPYWFPDLFQEARHLGLIPFASVFGIGSLAMLEALDCPAYKIAKPERHSMTLIDAAAATGKPVIISVPRRGDCEFTDHNGRAWPYEVYCPGGYPAKPESLDLGYYDREYIGLSCHLPDPLVGPVAVAAGAHYLEFHLTLDNGVPTLDDCVNLTQTQFAEMARLTRKAEAML